jgi:hypothetical protein
MAVFVNHSLEPYLPTYIVLSSQFTTQAWHIVSARCSLRAGHERELKHSLIGIGLVAIIAVLHGGYESALSV